MISLLVFGLTTQLFAQDPATDTVAVPLPEVTIVNTNYGYISSVDSKDTAIPVEELQYEVGTFNLKTLDIYEDEYDFYDVYFIIPEGKILASFDKDGNISRTVERFKNIDLPYPVAKAILKRFPNWSFANNVYIVNYYKSDGVEKKYKVTLENGDQRIKVKLDAQGNFL